MEKSTRNVWQSTEFKKLVSAGVQKVDVALNLIPGAERKLIKQRVYGYSPLIRHRLYKWAGKPTTSVFQIYCLLCNHSQKLGEKIPLNKVTSFDLAWFSEKPKTSSSMPTLNKEVKNEEETRVRARKTPIRSKIGPVHHHIPAHEERAEDYVNGVKYRVIVYFGRGRK